LQRLLCYVMHHLEYNQTQLHRLHHDSLPFTLAVRIRPHPSFSLLDSSLPIDAEEIHQLNSRYTVYTVSKLAQLHNRKTSRLTRDQELTQPNQQ
jgi:hypothetical protein